MAKTAVTRRILQVPLMDFEGKPTLLIEAMRDPEKFARDRANIVRGSIERYFVNLDRIEECVDHAIINPFDEATLQFRADFKPIDVNYYMHLDLSTLRRKKGDACGIAMAHVHGFRDVFGGSDIGVIKSPEITVDFMGRILPVGGREFDINDVLKVVVWLVDKGFNLRLITMDSPSLSAMPMQELRSKWGIVTHHMSIDRTANVIDLNKRGEPRANTNKQYLIAYETARVAWNEGRVVMPDHPYLFEEIKAAQYWVRKNRVQPTRGKSDDLLQAVIGAILNATVNEAGRDWVLRVGQPTGPRGINWMTDMIDPFYKTDDWKWEEIKEYSQIEDDRY